MKSLRAPFGFGRDGVFACEDLINLEAALLPARGYRNASQVVDGPKKTSLACTCLPKGDDEGRVVAGSLTGND